MKTIITIFLLLTLWSCKKDSSIESGTNDFYTPYLTSKRNNGTVTLKWGKPVCILFGNNVCPQTDPDHFEILMSNSSPSELKFHTTAKNNIFEITITNLTNGTPYYFAIKAVGQNALQIRFTNVREIVEMETILKAYIYEAIEVEKAGLKVALKKHLDLIFPEEFQNKFNEIPDLKTAFEALTPGRQRAYNLYFSEPKQSKTRESRVEKCMPQILNEKGLNDVIGTKQLDKIRNFDRQCKFLSLGQTY